MGCTIVSVEGWGNGSMARTLKLTKFKDVDLADPFFDSLKEAYTPFPKWFTGKAEEPLYILTDGSSVGGMIYLKEENGPVLDVEPTLPDRHWLKVGTLKIVGRGTLMGERVVKKIFDTALSVGADGIYVTVFDIHAALIALFERYGFTQQAVKTTASGVERVLVRSLTDFTGDRISDYPFLHTRGSKAWLLAVYPEYHTRLLPDSILNNEPTEIVQDVSHTNTIHKVYIAKLALSRMSPGDIVVFYRTTDGKSPARFRSVVTSVCVVEEVRGKKSFATMDDYLEYTRPRSVFTEEELRLQFATWNRLYVAKMTYNAAFEKRTTRGRLIDSGVMTVQPRWDLRPLDQAQLAAILEMGKVNARLIVD